MTNTLNTPVELSNMLTLFACGAMPIVLDQEVTGCPRWRCLVREIELLSNSQVTLLCDRQRFPPYGLAGGQPVPVAALH